MSGGRSSAPTAKGRISAASRVPWLRLSSSLIVFLPVVMPGEGAQALNDLGVGKGFGDEGAGADFLGHLPVLGLAPGGQDDDRQVDEPGIRAHRSQDLEAIHA